MPHPKLCDIRRACADWKEEYPPVLTLEQAAKIANVAPSTLKRHVSEERYRGCVKRGKPLLFWRDYFLQTLMKFESVRGDPQDSSR